jgi:hypothetical protein
MFYSSFAKGEVFFNERQLWPKTKTVDHLKTML